MAFFVPEALRELLFLHDDCPKRNTSPPAPKDVFFHPFRLYFSTANRLTKKIRSLGFHASLFLRQKQ